MSVLPPVPPELGEQRALFRWLNELHRLFGILQTLGDATPLGANQANASDLTDDYTEASTVTPSANAYRLVKGKRGISRTVSNGGNLNLYIYPAVGERIDTLAVDAPFTIPAGKTAIFFSPRPTQWRSMLGA